MKRRGRNDAPEVLNDGLINGDAAEPLNDEHHSHHLANSVCVTISPFSPFSKLRLRHHSSSPASQSVEIIFHPAF